MTQRTKCYECRELKDGSYHYHMAEKTPWRPPLGVDPAMRQFECKHCGNKIHIVFTHGMLYEEFASGK